MHKILNSMIIDVFLPCSFDGFSESNSTNLQKIIQKAGDTPVVPESFLCCGQSAYLQGFHELAKSSAIEILSTYALNRPIVSASTSCLGFIQKRYSEMFYNTSYHNEHKQLISNIMDITEYLIQYKKIKSLGAIFNHKVFYYASCSSLRKHEVKDAPISLLKNVKGLELYQSEIPKTKCCGKGGLFFFNYPSESDKLTNLVLDEILQNDIEYITSTDSCCLNKFQKIINSRKLNVKTIHIVDILASFQEQ